MRNQTRQPSGPALAPPHGVAPGLPEHAGAGTAPERASTGRPRRRPRLFAGAPWLAVVLAGAVVAGLTLLPGSAPARPARAVVAALPYWDIRNGTQTVLAHRGDFTEVSPWIYGLAASGRIETQYGQAQATAINADITRLRQAGLAVVPTLANITKGNWSYPPVARMLHQPALLKQHVSAIVAGVKMRIVEFENKESNERSDRADRADRGGCRAGAIYWPAGLIVLGGGLFIDAMIPGRKKE